MVKVSRVRVMCRLFRGGQFRKVLASRRAAHLGRRLLQEPGPRGNRGIAILGEEPGEVVQGLGFALFVARPQNRLGCLVGHVGGGDIDAIPIQTKADRRQVLLRGLQAEGPGATQPLPQEQVADGADKVGLPGAFQLPRQIVETLLHERVAGAIEHFNGRNLAAARLPHFAGAGPGGDDAVGRLHNCIFPPLLESCRRHARRLKF